MKNIIFIILCTISCRDFLIYCLESDFDTRSEYDEKANEKVCSVCFELLKEYISLHSSQKFKSTELLPGG